MLSFTSQTVLELARLGAKQRSHDQQMARNDTWKSLEDITRPERRNYYPLETSESSTISCLDGAFLLALPSGTRCMPLAVAVGAALSAVSHISSDDACTHPVAPCDIAFTALDVRELLRTS